MEAQTKFERLPHLKGKGEDRLFIPPQQFSDVADYAQTHPWIVALTANALWNAKAQCMEAGMNDFVSKPAKLYDIEQAIFRFMEHSN